MKGERALNGAVEPQQIQVEGQHNVMLPFNVQSLWVNQFLLRARDWIVEGEGTGMVRVKNSPPESQADGLR